MPSRYRLVLFACLVFAMFLAYPGPAAAQSGESEPGDSQYYPESGHWVVGEFLRAYQAVADPQKVYGYPITEAFEDPTIRRMVQYFQKARFELYPENPVDLKVRISPLGEYLYNPGQLLPVPNNFPTCRVYPETGYQVCYAFFEYYEENGGAAQFGYPISNFEIHAGRIMQYFQRARLEWHPELPNGQRVVLSDLGRLYFDTIRENPVRLLPAPVQDNRPVVVLRLQVRAFPQAAVMPLAGMQTIYIAVQDQNWQPVTGAEVKVDVSLPDGKTRSYDLTGETDKNGLIRFELAYPDQPAGQAVIRVQASSNSLTATTQTSFRIWW
jgi:hypothetical protein